jgi:hypothetical protein
MLTSAAVLAAVAFGATLRAKARREHRAVLERRAGLLASAVDIFPGSELTIGRDGFPTVSALLPDGRDIGIEIVADTLVTRRLPQLWLKLTVSEPARCRAFSIGALARPTGAEFYSAVHELPEWMAPPPRCDVPLLVRGRSVAAADAVRAGAVLTSLFADRELKEAVATPRGVRIVRRIAEGDRGAHLLLRQIRFPVDVVAADLIRSALSDAETLTQALSDARASRDAVPERAAELELQ